MFGASDVASSENRPRKFRNSVDVRERAQPPRGHCDTSGDTFCPRREGRRGNARGDLSQKRRDHHDFEQRAEGAIPPAVMARSPGSKSSSETSLGCSCERGDSNPAETTRNSLESRGLAVVSTGYGFLLSGDLWGGRGR
jgi:hypothetical protein